MYKHQPHLVISISGHGFGHVAQTAPILDALHQRMPQLRLTIRSSVAESYLRSRIKAPFAYQQSEGDIGMLMSSALDVRLAESANAYRLFHTDWLERVSAEAKILQQLGADAVFSNVGYLALAGAQKLGIPNVALCSLNWADIYRHYFGEDGVVAQMLDCYRNADAFFRLTPGMAMDDLPNLVPVPPVASIGQNRREELDQYLSLAPSEKLVLVSMGGIASRLPVENWPQMEGVRWLVQEGWQVQRADVVAQEKLNVSFADLLASCDTLLCKPGYGSFVEAACGGIPVLYVTRAGWPEAPYAVEWLQRVGMSCEISRTQLESGDFRKELESLLQLPRKPGIVADGAGRVCDWLEQQLA